MVSKIISERLQRMSISFYEFQIHKLPKLFSYGPKDNKRYKLSIFSGYVEQ